jgi:hypothetical protein
MCPKTPDQITWCGYMMKSNRYIFDILAKLTMWQTMIKQVNQSLMQLSFRTSKIKHMRPVDIQYAPDEMRLHAYLS